MPEWNPAVLLQSPIFEPLHPILARIENSCFPSLEYCNTLLAACHPPICVQRGLPLRFVAQEQGKLSFESQYEPRCFLSGEVQMRAGNLHDLFNALVWMTFPGSKAALNARHYHALNNQSDAIPGSQRGSMRDMATLFDESGVVVVSASSELSELLRNFQWHELFWHRRSQVQIAMGFYVFGHGLYEKALQPYIGITGQGLIVEAGQDFFSWPLNRRLAFLDSEIAEYLNSAAHCRSTRELTPVPLLGVPGWSQDNKVAEFYDNKHYFRPGRHK